MFFVLICNSREDFIKIDVIEMLLRETIFIMNNAIITIIFLIIAIKTDP